MTSVSLVIGPGVMVPADSVYILRIKGCSIEALMGRKNSQCATFDSAASARDHFDTLVLDLAKSGFVAVCDNFILSSRRVTKIFHAAAVAKKRRTHSLLCCCFLGERRAATLSGGRKAVVEFDNGDYKWGWDFANAENAVAFLEPIVQKCRRASIVASRDF